MAAEWGFVYFLGNECMPGIYKIGFTTNHPMVRVDQLSGATACPTQFEIFACFGVQNPREVEGEIHSDLSLYRVNESREFFRVPVRVLQHIYKSYVDEFTDLCYSHKLDAVCVEQKHYDDKEWKVNYFNEQCVDPINWPVRAKGFL